MNKKRKIIWVTCTLAAVALIAVLGIKAGVAQPVQQQGLYWLPLDTWSNEADQPEVKLLGASETGLNLQARMPGIWVEQVPANNAWFTRLSGDGYGFPQQVGMPELPVLRQEVEVPFGALISIEIVGVKFQDYSLANLGWNPIYPFQPSQIKEALAEQPSPFVTAEDFYTNGSIYPESPVSVGQEYIVRGHRILPVEIWPVAYEPKTGMIRLYSALEFRINLEESNLELTRQLAGRYRSPEFENILSQRVLYFNQGQGALDIAPDEPVGYLIITADDYFNALLPFAALKGSHGFDVTMTRLSEIPGGGSNAEIKAYIQTAYDTWSIPPAYVLLVGDTDKLPTWTGPVINTSTDLYYATMDGSADWHPDLGRGRFPVRSVDQAMDMVDKYLDYAQLTGQEPWLKTAAFPATCDLYQVAEGTHNYVINTYTIAENYWGSFPNNPQPGGDQLYCITHGAAHQDLLDAFNEGRWAIIYSGHGSYSGWEMNFTSTDIRNLTAESMFPFVASHACLTGNFGQIEVFGETWVLQENKGALVFWGSSTYSYWDEDDVLERGMFDSLFEADVPAPNVAGMTDTGLMAVESAYPGSARYYWETYNVLGDPAVKIFREPELPSFTLDITPSDHAVCTSGSLTSTVDIGSLQNYSATVYLTNGAIPENVNIEFIPVQGTAPFTSTLELDVFDGAAAGDHSIQITATDQASQTLDAWLGLRVVTDTPSSPALYTPANGGADQPLQPEFTWQAIPLSGVYGFELGQDPFFDPPLVSAQDLNEPSYTPIEPLEGGRCYWWRAQADNACGVGEWASPFYFSTAPIRMDFFDDLETGDALWSHGAAPGLDHWSIVADQSHSPQHAWHVPDDSSITDTRLWNTSAVPIQEDSELTFWHRFQFEDTYDGAVLEISIDSGGSWFDLGSAIVANGYNGVISTCCGNPLGGRSGWVQDLDIWTRVEVDLSAYAGQMALIRWRLGSDSSIGDTGWYIDDVIITSTMPPNPAPTITGFIPDRALPFEPTPVQISGSHFLETPVLQLGETWLLSATLVNTSTLNAVIPAGMPTGTYTLTLYNGDCQVAILPDAFTVTDLYAPQAADDQAQTDEDLAVQIEVLGNDVDPHGATLELVELGTPLHGTGMIVEENVVYTPTLDYSGVDVFTYTVTNGRLPATALVTVTVLPVNDPPVMGDVSLGPQEIEIGQAITLTGVFSDPDLLDQHTLLVEWVSGVTETIALEAGARFFSLEHVYAIPGEFTVTITIQDLEGLQASLSLEVTVRQVWYKIHFPIIIK